MTTGTFTTVGQHDWLKVFLDANQAYQFTITGLNAFSFNLVGTASALDDFDVSIGTAGTISSGTVETQTIWFEPSSSDTYYVDISNLDAASASYSVTGQPVSVDYTDNATTAGSVAVNGAATTGTLTTTGQHDWLAVSLTANQAYVFTINGLVDDAEVKVGTAAALDDSQVQLTAFTIPGSTPTIEPEQVWFEPATTGTYYVDLADFDGGSGAYSVTAQTVSADFTDNTATTGTLATNGVATNGSLTTAGQHDWLAVSLAANQAYQFTISGLQNDGQVAVGTAAALDESEVQTGVFTFSSGTSQTQTVWFEPATSGTYYVDIADFGGATGGYSVAAHAVAANYTDNATTTGTMETTGATTSGRLSTAGQHDWLKVVLAANQAYLFTVDGLDSSASLELGTATALDESEEQTAVLTFGSAGSAQTATAWFEAATAGTYYIDLSDGESLNPYTVSAVTVAADYTDNAATTGAVAVGGAATSGTLTTAGQHDWLAVSLNANQAYLFTVNGLDEEAEVKVGSAAALDDSEVQTETTSSFGTSEAVSAWFEPATSGTYYVDVSDGSTTAAYAVSAKAVAVDYTDNTTTTGVVDAGAGTGGSSGGGSVGGGSGTTGGATGGTTVSTVAGASGGTVSLDFGSAAVAAIATPLLAGVTAANALFVAVAGSSAMAAGQTAAIDSAAGAVTVTGNGSANETVAAGSGSFSFVAGQGGAGTVVAGSGNDLVNLANGGNWLAALGDGADTVVAGGGNDTIGTGTGGSFVFLGAGASSLASAGADTILGGSGNLTVNATGSPLFFNEGGATLFNAQAASATLVGAGNETVNAGSANMLVFGGPTGGLDFNAGSGASTVVSYAGGGTLNGGSTSTLYFGIGPASYNAGPAVDTVIGYGGGMTATGGANGTLFFTGSAGDNDLSTGSGATTIIGFGARDTYDATGAGAAVVYAAGASSTINAAQSSGGNTLFAFADDDVVIGGSGQTAIESAFGNQTLIGGSGTTLFELLDSGTAHAITIENFSSSDFVQLQGYGAGAGAAALKTAATAGGSEILTLSDGTRVMFQGVTGLTASSFV